MELVLSSQSFRRSERQSRFLRFICETTLNGEAGKLNEYLLAHAVFDRDAGYSPGQDSVVRRQAFSLRQKLHDYYGAEGKQDPLRIELPVGRYVPIFSSPPHESDREPAEEHPLAEPVASRQWPLVMMAVALMAACGVAGWLMGNRSRHAPLDPAVAEVWGPWLSDPQGALICFSSPMTAGIRHVEKPFPADSPTRGIPLTPEQAPRFEQPLALPAGGNIYLYPNISHGKMGEALGSIQLAVLFTKADVPVRTTQSRFLNWESFRSENLILLGHDEANKWVDPFLSKLPFRLAATGADKPRRIVNVAPRPGERPEYYASLAPGQYESSTEDFAIVSLLNGVDGRHRVALINGANTEGTQTALEYMGDPVSLRSLAAALRKAAPGHKGPWHFQALLHSELHDRLPTRVELIALRVLPD
ncbi:MAG: hypothetical protein JWO80_1008 [Bryobacterales bacterium]|nr:hypothetical protein [Bryobacterales bacterium]